jgi:rhodanese-related sulfurtransferase
MKKAVMHWLVVCTVAASVCLGSAYAWADDFPEIKAEQLKAKIDGGEKLTLINPLSKIEFEDGHIPGSVNIPLQSILIADNLPADKDQLIVTYCLGRK